jgi:YVTN family beta-propeller protein
MSLDGRMLAVADQGSNAVSIVDVSADKERTRLSTGVGPSALAFGGDGVLYVADMFANEVSAIDPKSGATLARIPVGVFPRAIAVAGQRVYVANWANSTIDVSTGALSPMVFTPGSSARTVRYR